MDISGFMHKYYDWDAFEKFVKDLYECDGDVTVQRDVTELDRYGAKRQTDVKIVRRTRFHKFITLVECKRWKDPVSRDRIDVLAASVEALSANNGAIFTTTGFEEGAKAYAKGKGIDLFVIRDLTPSEWGLPGRHISLYLHVNAAELSDIKIAGKAISLVDGPSALCDIRIELSPDKAIDPDFDLFSVMTGERGLNLVAVLSDAHRILLEVLGNSVGVFDDGGKATMEIKAHCELDLTKTEFHQLRLPKVVLRIKKIGFLLRAHIMQSMINADRGKNLDFAIMVESYISDQRLIAHRRDGDPNITFKNMQLIDTKPTGDPIQNDSLIRVYCSPWVGLGETAADKIKTSAQTLKVVAETDGGKPRLTLYV